MLRACVTTRSCPSTVLEDPRSGKLTTRHESLLRVMPQAIKPGQCSDKNESLCSPARHKSLQALETVDRFWTIRAKPDGACFYRCVAMTLQLRSGVPPCYLQDNDAQAEDVRAQILRQSQLFVQGCSPERLAEAQEAAVHELLDEPLWDHEQPFSWQRFWDFLRQPRSYTTAWSLGRAADLFHTSISIWQLQSIATDAAVRDVLQEVWVEDGDPDVSKDFHMDVLRTGHHYDLLVARRVRGKAPGALASTWKP